MSRIQKLNRQGAGLALFLLVLATCVATTAVTAGAQTLNVKIRSDRGDGAVYQPGDAISLSVKTNRDANLIVYEIDAEGSVHVLFPTEGNDTSIDGGTALQLPESNDEQMVVEGPVGEGFIVAIASDEPFRQLPWYLRPPDPRAQELGYTSSDERESEGVTSDGKIVGDPFVAMERIRRAVLAEGVNSHTFATAYTSYYVHNEVRYPRYLCNDCHRPGYYSWWDGFDPYYANCSAFEFRVNSNWWWGPTYWSGYVPYYAYVYRTDCPPRYRPQGSRGGVWYSSWDGWKRWTTTWGGPLRRYKTPPPAGYVAPADWRGRTAGRGAGNSDGGGSTLPPGYFASAHDRWNRTSQPGGGQPSGIRRERVGGAPSDGSGGGAREWRTRGGSGGGSSATPTPAPAPESGRSRRGGWDQGNNGSGRSGNNPGNDNGSAPPSGGGRETRQQQPAPDPGRWTPRPQPQPKQEAPAPRNPDRGAQRPDREAEQPRSDDSQQQSPPPESTDRPRHKGSGNWNP